MKKSFLYVLAAVTGLFLGSSIAVADTDIPITPDKLPAAAQTFIKQYFPEQTIIFAEKDVDFMKTKYEVHLDDGSEINFTGNGDWDKVECKLRPVPAALVPEAIATTVQAQFPGSAIMKIDKEKYGWEIELNNDLDLKFSKTGQLYGIDD